MNTVLIVLGVAAYVAVAVALFFLLRKIRDKFIARGWRCPDMYNPWMDLLVAALWPVQIVGIIYGLYRMIKDEF